MLRLSGGQVETLFDLGLPVEVRALPADLAALDRLLGDPALLAPVERAWDAAARGFGRPTIPIERLVRLMVIKQRSGWGYETLVREVSDLLHLRRFCRIALTERLPDESTVRKLARRLGAEVVEVRLPEELDGVDGLVIPGGESTAIMRLIRLYGLEGAIRGFGAPVLGTCAGMILLDRAHLGLVDVAVERNGYGRQVASFEADLELAGDGEPLRGIFIRAPRVLEAGPEVEVLATYDGEPVLLRQGRFLVASFHPELTADTRVHQRFLELIREETHVRA